MSPGLTVRGRRAKGLRCRLLPTSRRSSGPTPPLPHDLPPLAPGRGLSQQVSPPFLVGIVTGEQPGPRMEGGWEDQLFSVLGLRVSTGCPLPSLILTPILAWTPVRAEHPKHLLPIISHSSWQALLEETSSGGGGNHPLHQLPEQSRGQGVSKKEARGGGGDIQGQRDGEASRSIFLLPFPCIPQHPQDLGWGCVDLS